MVAEMVSGTAAERSEKEIASLRERKNALAARLAAAESTLVSKQANAEELAAGGADDVALEKAVAEIGAAERMIGTLRGGLRKIEAELADKETAALEREAEELREHAAAEIDEQRREGEAIAPELIALLDRAAKWALRNRTAAVEIGQLGGFLTGLKLELHAAFDNSLHLLQSTADHIRSGTRSPVRPAANPVTTAPAPPVSEPPTTEMFTLENVLWTTASGERKRAGKYMRVNIPSHLVEAGITANYIDMPLSKRAQTLAEFAYPYEPSSDDLCKNLDELVAPPAPEPPLPDDEDIEGETITDAVTWVSP